MARPRAAAVLHWDTMHRQVRIEGPIVRSPAPESDAYFASRALESRISAWASAQSQPLPSRAELIEKVRKTAERFHVAPGATSGEVPRPPHWGGYRLWFDTVELWTEGSGRVHDRALWKRTLQPKDAFGFTAAPCAVCHIVRLLRRRPACGALTCRTHLRRDHAIATR